MIELIFDKEEFFDVRSELFSEELTANEVIELLDTTIPERSEKTIKQLTT